MDNVSHTLVGAALGQTGLKRMTGLGMATLMIAANLPDLDVIAIPLGANLTFRRGWTHGPIGIVLLPILLTAAIVGFDKWQARRGRRPAGRPPVSARRILVLAYVGALSHPFLDWLNSYGIRLLMPFSHEWFYGDALFIVDPWLWLMLIAGIVLSCRAERKEARPGGTPAIIALVALTVYINLMIAGSRHAEHLVHAEASARSIDPVDQLMVGPVPVNPFIREVILRSNGEYFTGSFYFGRETVFEIDAAVIPVNMDHPAVRRAMQEPPFADFMYWSRFPFFTVEVMADSIQVTVNDVRFAGRPGTGWASRSVRMAQQNPVDH
jgi:inner membrane protein